MAGAVISTALSAFNASLNGYLILKYIKKISEVVDDIKEAKYGDAMIKSSIIFPEIIGRTVIKYYGKSWAPLDHLLMTVDTLDDLGLISTKAYQDAFNWIMKIPSTTLNTLGQLNWIIGVPGRLFLECLSLAIYFVESIYQGVCQVFQSIYDLILKGMNMILETYELIRNACRSEIKSLLTGLRTRYSKIMNLLVSRKFDLDFWGSSKMNRDDTFQAIFELMESLYECLFQSFTPTLYITF